MPTKKTRIGFIPREDVIFIINKLSIENNLSKSKVISILVEEALSTRGLYSNKTGKNKLVKSNDSNEFDHSLSSPDVGNIPSRNTKPYYEKIGSSMNLNVQNNVDILDLQTYEKFLSFLKFQDMMNKYETL